MRRMSLPTLRYLVAVVALTAAPTTGLAQVVDSTVAGPPSVPGGVYDKPYLTNLLGRTALGGYAETQARWEQVDGVRDGLGFQLKRWNLFTATRVNDFVRIGAELEVEELGEEITLEYAAIDVTIHPALTLRAGALLSPLGRFNLSHDSPRNEFTDRPIVSTDILGTALTEPGLGVLGLLPIIGAGRVTYELYAVNGFHDGLLNESSEGVRLPAGKKNFEDNNNSLAVVGRLAWSPRSGYELGLSGHRGAWNTFELDGQQVEERLDLTILAVDAEVTVAEIVLSGEAVRASLNLPPTLGAVFAGRQHGLYVQGVREFGRGWVRTMPGSYFETGIRYDAVDFDLDETGDSRKRITLGVNFRPSSDVAMKLNYIRGRTRDRFNNAGDEAGLLFSIATYF
jgi:hypothetical protein